MDHFKGVTPGERWKNDVLNELRNIRKLLEKSLGRDAQTPKKQEVKRTYRKRGDKS